jgi:4-amino-4-deoxy-L-arabinose transferase-like glycosyltransferase
MRVLGAVLVALCAIVVVFLSVLKHPVYTPDGSVYARFAARDAGYSDRDATIAERAFYGHTPLVQNPRYREIIDLPPNVWFARSHVFVNRILYPWVVGMAMGAAGLRGLFLVSAAAYAAFGLALYWMLLAFKRPVLAFVLAIAALGLPQVRDAGASDLTDMLALVWWVLALGALLRLARETRPATLALLALSGVLLALTRPTPYLVVLPALAIGIVRASWAPLIASLGSVAAYAIVAFATHAYGVSEQLHWIYDNLPNGTKASFPAWYRGALSSSIRFVVVETARTIVPLIMIAATVFGLWRSRTRAEMAVLAAAAIACLIAVPFNPVPSSFARIILLPLVPVFCAIAQCAIEPLIEGRTAKAPVEPAPEIPASA